MANYAFDIDFQVFTVRSGGSMGVVVKGPNDKNSITFRYAEIFHRLNFTSTKFSCLQCFDKEEMVKIDGRGKIHCKFQKFYLSCKKLTHHDKQTAGFFLLFLYFETKWVGHTITVNLNLILTYSNIMSECLCDRNLVQENLPIYKKYVFLFKDCY